MKKVLLFQTSNVCHGILSFLNQKIADSLRLNNIQCDVIKSKENDYESINELRLYLKKGYDAAIAFNQTFLQNITISDGKSVFDEYHVPFYNYIVDYPMGYSEYTDVKCKDYHVICVDLDHVDQVRKYCPSIKDVSFLPIGGIETDTEQLIPHNSRPYDIVFYAGYEKMKLKEMLAYFGGLPDPYPILLLNMIDCMIANRDYDNEKALKKVLKDVFNIKDMAVEEFRKLLVATAEVSLFMRTYIREEVVRTLVDSSVPLHLFGDGWEQRVGRGRGQTIFHDGVDYNKIFDVLGQSKMVINVFPWFKNGSNERVANGMLRKTAVLSDKSKYLEKCPKGIMYRYDINAISKLPDIILSILANESDMIETTERGYSYAKQNMTWERMIEKLLSILNL